MSGPTSRWQIVSASIRGSVHVATDTPNEDFVDSRQATELALIAVADGHGSEQCPRSDIGSRLAVQHALDLAAGVATEPDALSRAVSPKRSDLGRRLVDAWRRAVDAHLAQNPLSDREHELLYGRPPEYAYGSTVLLAGCTATLGFALQLGDGHIILVDTTGSASLAFPDDKRIATETDSLCMREAEQFVQTRTWPIDGTHPTIISASTDGFGDAFEDRRWFEEVGRQLWAHVRVGGATRVDDQLETWLSRNAGEFGDDTTMALLIETPTAPSTGIGERTS